MKCVALNLKSGLTTALIPLQAQAIESQASFGAFDIGHAVMTLTTFFGEASSMWPWMPILPPARPHVLEYLEARKNYLDSRGLPVNSWPLIPSIYNGEVKEHSSNNFRDIKEKIEERAQMDFKIKDFRSTCAQMIKDRNKGPTEIATKQLRHSGPETTYRSHAQIKSDTANDEVNNLFSQSKMASISKSTSCEDIQTG